MSSQDTKEKSQKAKILEEVFEEYQDKKNSLASSANSLVKSTDFENQLQKIEQQLTAIIDRQKNGVSAEFNALMDGYVNKANESQEFKVKANHIESLYEDLNLEFKTVKEENKKVKYDLEAAKEALRMSELDIKRIKNELNQNRNSFEEQIAILTEERDRFRNKLKEVQTQNDENIQSYNTIKSELLEQRYKMKQIDQERKVEEESKQRNQRETEKLIDELKEKLDLRTREVEYKDALLNQLIKQVSVEDNLEAKLNLDFQQNPARQKTENHIAQETPKANVFQKPQRIEYHQNANSQQNLEAQNSAQEHIEETPEPKKPMSLKERIKEKILKPTRGASLWGPFRRK